MYKINTVELKKEMAECHIDTITELSSLAGVNRNTTAQVVNGEIIPSTDVMYRLAEALKCNAHRAGEIFFCHKLT